MSSIGSTWLRFSQVPSTNGYLKENAERLPHGTVATAQGQSQGRGRRQTLWRDQPGKGVLFSVLLKKLSPQQAVQLPLISAVFLCRTLRQLSGAPFLLKWPNDLVIWGKKAGGILCEGSIAAPCPFVVCGIGLNLLQEEKELQAQGLSYATSVMAASGVRLKPSRVEEALVQAFGQMEAEGFVLSAALLEEYKQYSAVLGKEVRVVQGEKSFCGSAVDIGPQGQLVIRRENGVLEEYQGSQVSVRGLYGYTPSTQPDQGEGNMPKA